MIKLHFLLSYYIFTMTCCKKSLGLLIIRIGFGAFFLMGGIGKIMGATPEMMNMIGGAAHGLGLTFLPTNVWFRLAAGGEVLAGLLFVLGIFLPFAALIAVIIMLVAFFGAHNGDMQQGMSALAFLIASLGLGIAGPGKYSLKSLLCKSCDKWCTTGACAPKQDTKEVVNV
jgi:putative oxidoreductase